MNTANINDQNFLKSDLYKNYLKENSGTGLLKIRAYAASQAVPIQGLNVIVSRNIENTKVIFFEGATNASGVIDNIILPAPVLDEDNLIVPNKATYEVEAIYKPDNFDLFYKVNIYENFPVVQNINIVPTLKVGGM